MLVLAVAVLSMVPLVRSQDQTKAVSGGSTVTPGSTPATTPAAVSASAARIIGAIPDGTPPPPQAPKPQFVARGTDILDSKVREQGGRTITIQEIKPIALPQPPMPQPESRTAQIDNAAFKQHLAEYRASHPEQSMLSLGATVYRFKDTPPRTLVRYWPEHGNEPFTFWSSADFSLISGIHSFPGTDGRTYSLFLAWGNIDTSRTAALLASHGREYTPPDVPDFPDGPASFSIVGTPPADPSVLVPIQSLHDIYNKEFWRLKTAYEGRELASLLHEADLKAHPPQPKNLVVNFWTTDTPAPAKKGGSK